MSEEKDKAKQVKEADESNSADPHTLLAKVIQRQITVMKDDGRIETDDDDLVPDTARRKRAREKQKIKAEEAKEFSDLATSMVKLAKNGDAPAGAQNATKKGNGKKRKANQQQGGKKGKGKGNNNQDQGKNNLWVWWKGSEKGNGKGKGKTKGKGKGTGKQKGKGKDKGKGWNNGVKGVQNGGKNYGKAKGGQVKKGW